MDPRGSLTAITMSYSLSMASCPDIWTFFFSLDELTVPHPLNPQIPPFYQVLDRCDQVLDTQRGLMAVVDFYTSRELGNKERVSPPPLLFFLSIRWSAHNFSLP